MQTPVDAGILPDEDAVHAVPDRAAFIAESKAEGAERQIAGSTYANGRLCG